MKYFEKLGKKFKKPQYQLSLAMDDIKLLDAQGKLQSLHKQRSKRSGDPILRLKKNPQFPIMKSNKLDKKPSQIREPKQNSMTKEPEVRTNATEGMQ